MLMLRQAWPTLTFILTADACQAPALLRHQPYRLVVVDELLVAPPLPQLLEQLFVARAAQQLLLLTSPPLLTILRQDRSSRQTLALLPRHAAPEAVLLTIGQLLHHNDGESPEFRNQSFRRGCHAHEPPTPFSRRELEVLRLIMADYCNQEIADQLHLSVRTVESHRRALLQKSGLRTLVGLAVQAVRQGWVTA
ncbi:hypothetical protein GCM10022408_13120 [Hymenobacter fastidiosus]|uniref:HTH luxR-type domain-containing protein n=1 Tax=Hymenobacter fastidiosus TaxID=486264 RepID=A0ABP7RWD0_9BACT